MTGSPTGSTRLSADDFVRAAFEVMVDEGISGVKIARLCERLGVTKGSFYWHFADLDAFLGEVARQWAEDGVRKPRTLGFDAEETDATDAMLHAMTVFSDRRNRALTRAVREWAQKDERAREAIRAADEALFQRVKGAFAALGFDDKESEVRAKVLYYAGVGYASVGNLGELRSADQMVATWEILTRK
jgi:AcrR family transcriptional regulator